MGHSNYKLTDEQKGKLNNIAQDIIDSILTDISDEHMCLNVYDTPDGKLDHNMITAIIWYIGDRLSTY
jgi:hypothetical protein